MVSGKLQGIHIGGGFPSSRCEWVNLECPMRSRLIIIWPCRLRLECLSLAVAGIRYRNYETACNYW